jgi:hypothetical protein
MFRRLWTLSTTLRGYSRACLPSNRAVDWLRAPPGLTWALPVALTAAPAYLYAASVCASAVNRGGPGYLNALVLLFFWNAVKFAVMGALTPITGRANLGAGSRGRHRHAVDA